jgi:hypothetical protein
MADVVRPRVHPIIYKLAVAGAKAKCVTPSSYIANAIIEKAARDGLEIVDSNITAIKKEGNEEIVEISHNGYHAEKFKESEDFKNLEVSNFDADSSQGTNLLKNREL